MAIFFGKLPGRSLRLLKYDSARIGTEPCEIDADNWQFELWNDHSKIGPKFIRLSLSGIASRIADHSGFE